MYKIFIPCKKAEATSRGYWLSDSGKLCKDFIHYVYHEDIGNSLLEDYRLRYNQEAIFYIYNGNGYIWNGKDLLTLNKHFKIQRNVKKLKYAIPYYVKKYNGLTITKLNTDTYKIEVYYNE